MERYPVNSSHLVSVGYDASSWTLEIEFNDGSVYQYFDVAELEYQELVNSSSVGQYFHNNIKEHYQYTRL